jgi:hypothetical protein
MEWDGIRDLKSTHAMHAAVLAPPAERLAFPPEEDTEETPEGDESGVGHDGTNKAALHISVIRQWNK